MIFIKSLQCGIHDVLNNEVQETVYLSKKKSWILLEVVTKHMGKVFSCSGFSGD